MTHPLVMYELARLRIADDLRQAERDRMVREAGSARRPRSIDAVPFRDRVARLFGLSSPSTRDGVANPAP
jgi:hypothetical protein